MATIPDVHALDFQQPVASFDLTDTSPTSVVVSDLDGDGNEDMAFALSGASGGDASINLLFGNGAGDFSAGGIATGLGPHGLTAGDFNGDGFMDLAAAMLNNAVARIYLGDGARGFTLHSEINLPATTPDAIATADFDQNGILDLVITSQSGDPYGAYVVLGIGDGTFAAPVEITSSRNLLSTDVTIADVNGDLHMDIVTPPALYLGKGDGNFDQTTALSGGLAVDVADLDNDGDLDIIAVGGSFLITRLGNGDGTFTLLPPESITGASFQDVVIEDIDHDGHPDVLASSQAMNTVEIFLGLGDGSFAASSMPFTTGVAPYPLAVADWNEDGHLDFATGNDDPLGPTASIGIQNTPVPLPGNVPPVANLLRITTVESMPVAMLLTASDDDGDALTYTVISQPVNGIFTLETPPNLIYQPNPGFFGVDSFTFQASDGQANSNIATVFVTVEPNNETPVANGQLAVTNEDTPVGITLTADDADIGNVLTYSVVSAPIPSHGGLTGTAPNLTFHPAANFHGTASFTFKANDGLVDSNVATVTINVNAVNDTPTVFNLVTVTDEKVPVDVLLLGNDVDGDVLTFRVTTGPTNGAITGTAPNVTYTPNADFFGNDSFTYVGNDGLTDSLLPATVSITVNAVNDAPVAIGQTVSGDEDSVIPITLTGTDADGDALSFVISTQPTNGTLSGTGSNLSYTPTADFNGTDNFSFIVDDGLLSSALTATITIIVNPLNDAPVISNQSVSADEDNAISVTLLASDVDGDAVNFVIVTSPSNGTISGVAPNLTYTPKANFNGVDSFIFNANDSLLISPLAKVSITVNPVNDAPVANGGPNQTVFVGDNVILDGSASTDVDGDTLIYFWFLVSKPAGSRANIIQWTSLTTDFVVDLPGTYVVEHYVGDASLLSAPDTIIINTQNSAPVANAGPDQTLLVGDLVTLNGSASSDVDGDLLTYSWTLVSQPLNSTAALFDATVASPTFTIDQPGNYIFELVVNDGLVGSLPDSVTINTGNSAPVANGGPDQTVFVGDSVILDGSASTDVDGDTLVYFWFLVSKPAGSQANIIQWTSLTTNFVVDLPGTYVVEHYVGDASLLSAPDTIIINTQNSAPVANAGPDQTLLVGNLVTLNGSASSDVDGDLLSYNWSLISVPLSSTAAVSDPMAINPTFTADVAGSYVAQLIVNDGAVDSAPDTVMINVNVPNMAPVADAGMDQSAFVGDLVILDGGGSSDADGDPLAYSWSLISVPLGSSAAVSDPMAVNPTFTADVAGSYVAQLMVNDGVVDSAPDTVVINVDVPNTTPVADAGLDQDVLVGNLVTLDGGGSSDADGDPLAYSWSLISVPLGSSAAVSDPMAVNLTFTADVAGIYVAQLIVNDGAANSVPDTVTITASDLTGGVVSIVGANWDGLVLMVSGTGTPGATVNVSGADTGEIIATAVTVAADGSWSVTSVLAGEVPCMVSAVSVSGVDLDQLAVTGATGVCTINITKARWEADDDKLLLKGRGLKRGVQYVIQYTSTGVQLANFTGPRFDKEIELNSSSAPCSIRFREATGSAFIDQPVTNAPAGCL